MIDETWVNKKWRPLMAMQYIAVCCADFMIFPILWSVLQAIMHQTITPWDPLTLKGAGLYHFAMGAILGVAAWSRGQEKITAMNMMGMTTSTTTTEGQTPVR